MILSLTVTNWMSFKDETRWLLVASQERTHRDRLPKKGRLAVSPIAAIFGPNASGKTNLVAALAFIQQLVLKGPPHNNETSTGVRPYALSGTTHHPPTTFELELLINDRVYAYTVSLTTKRIIKEELSEIRSNKPICLYRRQATSESGTHGDTDHFHFDRTVRLTPINELRFVAKRTHPLRLFLSKSSEENIPDYAPIFNWFKSLVILNDRSEFQLIEHLMEDTPLSKEVGRWLHELDTGIVKLGKMPHPNLTDSIVKQVESDSIAEGLKELFRKNPDQKVMARWHTQGTYMIEPTQDGSLTASELAAIHRDDAGGEVPFPMAWLSDGSKVLIHLLPVFRLMVSRPMVLVVDELGRHFHHDRLLSLIDGFLRSCTPKSRSQLIFTTHNQSLMTQSLLRLDEMWVVEKHGNHSTLYSFVEFEGLSARTDVAKRYRQGHLGGLPTLYDPEWPEQMQGDDEG